MLGQRPRWWTSIKTTLSQRLVFAGHTRHWPHTATILGRSLARWPTIEPTLIQQSVFTGFCNTISGRDVGHTMSIMGIKIQSCNFLCQCKESMDQNTMETVMRDRYYGRSTCNGRPPLCRPPSKHGEFAQYHLNVGPPSTLAQHWNSIGRMSRVCWATCYRIPPLCRPTCYGRPPSMETDL